MVGAKGKRKMCEPELQPLPLPSPPLKSCLVQRMQNDTCFRCRQQGHWGRDCPLNSPNLKSRASITENSDFPKIYCRCGHGYCEVKTATNERNCGRRYYVCPIKRGKKCRDFVKWCDDPVDETDLRPPTFNFPTCSCGAGVCRREKERNGPNEGRYYFACPIGEGHGACDFRLWEDTLLGVFPFFDNIIVPRKESKHDGLCESNQLLITNPEVSENEASLNLSPGSQRKAMSKAQRQKELLRELESLNPLDYKSMRDAAEGTIDLLSSLSIDYTQFSEHVWAFINSTSSLAEIENSVKEDLSPEEYINDYVKTKALLEGSHQHSQSLRKEASRLKAMLHKVEDQLTSCELEMLKMETHLGEINASMVEAEKSEKAAAQASTARKLCEEKKA